METLLPLWEPSTMFTYGYPVGFKDIATNSNGTTTNKQSYFLTLVFYFLFCICWQFFSIYFYWVCWFFI